MQADSIDTEDTALPDGPATPEDSSLPEASKMKGHVIRGVIQVGIASVIMRGGGLIAQFVAGVLLTKDDFGLFAITLAFSTFAVAMLSALRPLFIERLTKHEDADRLWRLILWVMTGLAVAMMLGSGPLADALGKPEARLLLIVMAPTLPLQFAQVIGIARLGAQLRFADSSKILTASALSRHSALIAFAFMGFGAYALVLPLFVEALVEGTLLWRATGRPPSLFGHVRGVWARYGRTLPWLLLTAVALGASLSGDYLAISLFVDVEIVGLYFFGYSLSAALTQPFTMAATNVLVPSFASVKSLDRLRVSYLEAISLLLLATGMAFGGLALVGGTLVDLIWSGKWNESIVAMVLISAGTPFRILQPTCYSLLQAREHWSTHSLLATLNATMAIGGAVIGALIGGLFEIALLVGIAGGVVGNMVAVIAGMKIGIPPHRTVVQLLRGALPPSAGLLAAFLIVPGFLATMSDSIIRGLIFLAVSMPIAFLLFRSSIASVITSARGRSS